MHHIYSIWVIIFVLTSSVQAQDRQAQGATAARIARTEVLRQLADLRAPLIIGQHIGQGHEAKQGMEQFCDPAKLGGRQPVLIGIDYGWEAFDSQKIHEGNVVLTKHWRRGGLVSIIMCPSNPSGGGLRTTTGTDLAAILRSGSPEHQRWLKDLDVVATGLGELRDAGVPVLWRPLNEMNGDWFWWGAKSCTVAHYQALWRHMYQYFTVQKKLDNLIWIWAPNARLHALLEPPLLRYPGADYVDVVGMSIYQDNLGPGALNPLNSTTELISLGKPFVISEIGPAKNRGSFDGLLALKAVQVQCPSARFCLWWSSWTPRGIFGIRQRLALVDNPNAAAVMTDPGVLTLAPEIVAP